VPWKRQAGVVNRATLEGGKGLDRRGQAKGPNGEIAGKGRIASGRASLFFGVRISSVGQKGRTGCARTQRNDWGDDDDDAAEGRSETGQKKDDNWVQGR